VLAFLAASYIIFDISLTVILVVSSCDPSISALSAAVPSQIVKFVYNIRSSVIRVNDYSWRESFGRILL
jgi:hypothetical protein